MENLRIVNTQAQLDRLTEAMELFIKTLAQDKTLTVEEKKELLKGLQHEATKLITEREGR